MAQMWHPYAIIIGEGMLEEPLPVHDSIPTSICHNDISIIGLRDASGE